MIGPIEIFQMAGAFLLGMLVRFLFLVAVIAVFSLPIVLLYGIMQGWSSLREHLAGFVRVGGLLFAPARRYASNHLWLASDRRGGGVKVGLDDLARRLFPHAESISVVRADSRIVAGDPLAEIVLPGGRRASIPSPISGRIVEANAEVLAHPSLLEKDPFEKGWLLRLVPDDEAWRLLPTGAEARRWLLSEEHRLSGLFERELGFAAADGGELVGPAAALLSAAAWKRLVHEIMGNQG